MVVTISLLHQLIGRMLGLYLIESGLRQEDGSLREAIVAVGDMGAVVVRVHPDDLPSDIADLPSDRFVRLVAGKGGPFVPGVPPTSDGEQWGKPPFQLSTAASKWLGAKYPHLRQQTEVQGSASDEALVSAAAAF